MPTMTKHQAIRQVESIRKRSLAMDRKFRREYPNLICFLDGEKNIDECKFGYYRDKVNGHVRTIADMEKKATRLQSYASRMKELF